jgi:hypothetical protein
VQEQIFLLPISVTSFPARLVFLGLDPSLVLVSSPEFDMIYEITRKK